MGPALPFVAKLALPVVLVASGGAAVVLSESPSAAARNAQVWIDAPIGASRLPVGSATIYSHSTSIHTVASLTLSVDGAEVAATSTLTRTGNLVYATFTWQASAGTHTLVVHDPTDQVVSATVTVYVGQAGPTSAQPTPGVSSVKPSKSPASSSSAPPSSATSTQSATPTRTTSRSSTPTHPSSPPHTSHPPSSTAPPALAIQSVSVSPTSIDYICPGPTKATVTAHVTGATAVTAYYGGKTYPMTLSGGLWTATIDATAFTTNQGGPVSVEAVHPGEKAVDKDTAPLTLSVCKP